MKIKLQPEPKFDLDKLLDIAVPTGAVPPEAGVPAAVPPAAEASGTVPPATGAPGAEASETGDPEKLLAEAPVTEAPAKPGGRFDRYHSQFPELVKCYFRTGATAMLKVKAQELGFGSMSKLIRSALKYALSHGDFKEGWDK